MPVCMCAFVCAFKRVNVCSVCVSPLSVLRLGEKIELHDGEVKFIQGPTTLAAAINRHLFKICCRFQDLVV